MTLRTIRARATIMANRKILLAEDETQLRNDLAEILEEEGFEVRQAHNGEHALEQLADFEPDLILTDIKMPRMTGWEFLNQFRRDHPELHHVPVVFLSALSDRGDIIAGMAQGADDYVTKPVDYELLVARIRARLGQIERMRPAGEQSSQPETSRADSTILRFGNWSVDTIGRQLKFQGKPVVLTSTEFELLSALVRAAPDIVARDSLFQTVLGRPWMPGDRAIDGLIAGVRQKMNRIEDDSCPIKTVRGKGYVLAADVEAA